MITVLDAILKGWQHGLFTWESTVIKLNFLKY